MTYGTHMLGGALGGIIMLNMSSPDPDAAFAILGGSVIGALLPDLDHTQSKISRSNVGTSIIAELVSLLTKHRGILHTPIFWRYWRSSPYRFAVQHRHNSVVN